MTVALLQGFAKTPPLWINEQFGITQFPMDTLLAEINQTVDIPKNLRLGHQMEYLFASMIQMHPVYELLARNILINQEKLRVGELDFLIRNKNSYEVIHVELAYKFYLVDPKISEPIYRLVGPNRRDMFFKKLDKLKEKQFPLLYHNSLQYLWESLNVAVPDVQQMACLKAQLFSPYPQKSVNIRPLNENCLMGYWVDLEIFANEPFFKEANYYLTHKIEWVVTPVHDRNYVSHYEILIEVNMQHLSKNAPMLWMRKPEGILEKLFVVWW